jgi:hypothetical protein
LSICASSYRHSATWVDVLRKAKLAQSHLRLLDLRHRGAARRLHCVRHGELQATAGRETRENLRVEVHPLLRRDLAGPVKAGNLNAERRLGRAGRADSVPNVAHCGTPARVGFAVPRMGVGFPETGCVAPVAAMGAAFVATLSFQGRAILCAGRQRCSTQGLVAPFATPHILARLSTEVQGSVIGSIPLVDDLRATGGHVNPSPGQRTIPAYGRPQVEKRFRAPSSEHGADDYPVAPLLERVDGFSGSHNGAPAPRSVAPDARLAGAHRSRPSISWSASRRSLRAFTSPWSAARNRALTPSAPSA